MIEGMIEDDCGDGNAAQYLNIKAFCAVSASAAGSGKTFIRQGRTRRLFGCLSRGQARQLPAATLWLGKDSAAGRFL